MKIKYSWVPIDKDMDAQYPEVHKRHPGVSSIQELSLRVTVAENTEDGRGENVGHVIIGPEASGMGITHWKQMLATLRKPVSMWHPIRRI